MEDVIFNEISGFQDETSRACWAQVLYQGWHDAVQVELVVELVTERREI